MTNSFIDSAKQAIAIQGEAIDALAERIDDSFIKACETILSCQGRVVVTGMGKSGHIGNKIAATLASTGTPAFFVHPGEASHGDLGMITGQDVVLAISNSGNTSEILTIVPLIRRMGAPLISMTGNADSALASVAVANLDVSVPREACPLGLAPTSSTTATLVMGDALAVALLEARGFSAEDFAFSHPGGTLGRRLLLRVSDIMHTGIFGTLVGEYLGLKFLWPELDHVSWLSFGRLRPVHTNTVFWGWASLAMIGLGYFVIARTSNTVIYNYRVAWAAFILINLTVILGNLALMGGINNGGGEYREYIWPIMILFAIGLILTLYNYYKTVATRKISEIYISNWFILASLIWTIVLAIVGYLPWYQNGLGETVIQGYYMHQGVGMWFMTFTLGLVYYYLPATLNKPIYSYSLGVLAFWTQMLFYTMIGTHHFVFSPLPWWLQTTAIVFSAGMVIPVVAGTTNFLMTMKGRFSHISKSYVLPFFLVGVIFYFVGSTQGSLQAFRFTNFVWHFTDFNVAHSHMTMYGIISFILWACVYTIVPKLTGKEPPQLFVGAHFWLAFIGLFAYMVSLMVGGTLKGLSWIDGNPFIESVILMKPYWAWRAVGGTLMFFSHLIFAYNLYYMIRDRNRDKGAAANVGAATGESVNV